MTRKNKKNKEKANQQVQNKIAKTPPKRLPNDLYKLYEKETINQEQYASGERLLFDYECSFRNKCTISILNEVRVQKSTKINNEFHIIQNLDAWDRYNKAISSIEDIKTRDVVRDFCIEGKGLTEIDNKMGKRGVAEVRLCYGLGELVKYYKNAKKLRENKQN